MFIDQNMMKFPRRSEGRIMLMSTCQVESAPPNGVGVVLNVCTINISPLRGGTEGSLRAVSSAPTQAEGLQFRRIGTIPMLVDFLS